MLRKRDRYRYGPGTRQLGERRAHALCTQEVAVAEVGGKIYVIGGFGGERELEIYDPVADRWTRGAAFPREVHHAGAMGLNGKLYVIGGFVDHWTLNTHRVAHSNLKFRTAVFGSNAALVRSRI
jgi:N-acetylneuraminic acid mutarotase